MPAAFSNDIEYWKPEHPPPTTPIRRPAGTGSCVAIISFTFTIAAGVSTTGVDGATGAPTTSTVGVTAAVAIGNLLQNLQNFRTRRFRPCPYTYLSLAPSPAHSKDSQPLSIGCTTPTQDAPTLHPIPSHSFQKTYHPSHPGTTIAPCDSSRPSPPPSSTPSASPSPPSRLVAAPPGSFSPS